MVGAGFVELKLDWAATKTLSIGDVLLSDEFSAGGHVWQVRCYPHGHKQHGIDGLHVSVFLRLVSESKNVRAIFDAFLMCSDGSPSTSHGRRCVQVYPPKGFQSQAWGYFRFVKRTDLDESSSYIKDGHVRFMFAVIVLPGGGDESPIAVPSSDIIAVPRSDIGDHLGHLLDSGDGSDVSFDVAGETFHAHRAVLVARSPVFKAQLLGSMADAGTERITLHGIHPETFEILLRFIYTDALPAMEDPEGSSSSSTAMERLEDLLVAADMYHLDRMKLVCAQKLWERVSPDNVAAMLGFAETHGCPELKKRCIDFFVVEKNFRRVALTEGYMRLMQSFPSVIDEIRTRIQA
ncbi:hypothetical protein HU200_061864 [Digitaria exilis]|uniref:Uncharacterized protein n=1 Tax=Digitaria exilis TaxID=1010633 RepID=A0A835AB64_9POAL|nr:hypothetical protein HU200_061864 [Digitaria exilis]